MLIYLVDDDQEDQEIFDMALCDSGVKAKLLCFNDADAVLSQINSSPVKPDYIFLDLNMPKINGLECLQMFVNNSITALSKVIIYSTSSNEKDIKETMALGAHNYLVKPVNFKVLVESIKKLLKAS
ncbi:response regulator [Arcticibacterium luteifluviistationis]|uniref:Response regulator n=1 Tax=Arcticibacterium luteifluviistationis TaxID=1784714 RepID=A0A2Z4GG67_9BACT|nr:response regulator [Arcticibacterium luteifluviistationis]AWW00390.1 response regulator [Arcticibacterium luteifluviistationis]